VFDSEGELLHATAAHRSQPQVQIFSIKPIEEVDDVKLRDVSGLFHLRENEFGSALVRSRVPWSNALSLTFGQEFESLMEMHRSFGKALISAGHVFDGVA
jgi:hypothetical protein